MKEYVELILPCICLPAIQYMTRAFSYAAAIQQPRTCSPQLTPSTIAMQNASVRDVLRKIWPCTRTPRTSLCSKAPKRRTLGASKSEGTIYCSCMSEERPSANTPSIYNSALKSESVSFVCCMHRPTCHAVGISPSLPPVRFSLAPHHQ